VNAQLLEGVPLPQRLALSYAPARSRGANLALMALDARLGAVVRGAREPIASHLRLAWWRETLAKPAAEWPRGEAVLDALREWRDPSCVADLPNAWEVLVAEQLTSESIATFVQGRSAAFACLALQLGVAGTQDAADSAAVWAAADLAANLSKVEERELVLGYAVQLRPPARLPSELRALAVLATLGRASLARGGGPLLGSPRTALLALRTGLTGR